MLTVNGDQGVVERQLAGGELACPECGGVLGGWGRARPRRIRFLDGPDAELVRLRSRCRACKATHVLLPAWFLLRRADAGEVIGAALQRAAAGRGHRTIARQLGRPPSTVRGWLRRLAGRAAAGAGLAAGGRLHELTRYAAGAVPGTVSRSFPVIWERGARRA